MMSMKKNEILEVICEWAIQKNINVSAEESLAYGLLSGVGIALGGLLFGRVGMAAAASVSAACAFTNIAEKAVSLAHMIRDILTAEQRRALTNSLLGVVCEFGVYCASSLLNSLLSGGPIAKLIISNLTSYFSKELHMRVMC